MEITHKIIISKIGRNSPIFTNFIKEFGNLNIRNVFQKNYNIWKSHFPSFSMIKEPNLNIETSMMDLDINQYYYLLYSYIAWCITNIAKIILPKYNFSSKIIQFFKWTNLITSFEFFNSPNSQNNTQHDHELHFASQDLFSNFLNNILKVNLREQKGMFYTPQILSKFISQLVVDEDILLSSKKILDPTCGTGSILLSITKEIFLQEISKEQKYGLISNIYGNDENPVAIMASILNILNVLKNNGYANQFIEKINGNFFCTNIFDYAELNNENSIKKYDKRLRLHDFDVIIGNLPWNVLNNIEDQTIIENIENISKSFDIFMSWKNRSNLEIATVLFKIIQFNLLSDNGAIIFLLPTSILTASQHSKFRRFVGLKSIKTYHIKPDYFPIHSMIFYGKNTNLKTSLDVEKKIEAYYYSFEDKNDSWKLYKQEILTPSYISYHNNKPLFGKYYSKINSRYDLPIKKSFYHKNINRGVDITPRRLLFVLPESKFLKEKEYSGDIIIKPDLNHPISTQSSNWNIIPFKQTIIDSNDIYPVIKSTNLIPYMLYHNHFAFLPLVLKKGHLSFKKENEMKINSKLHLEKINHIYSKYKKVNSKNNTLKESLCYGKKIYASNLLKPIKVVYPVGGSYCKAAILDQNKTMIDVTFYYLSLNSKAEAYYILAWLNSNLLNLNLHKVCTIGANGSIRVIHMAPWMFPLPKFESNSLQDEIVSISKEIEKYLFFLYDDNGINDFRDFRNYKNKKKRVSLTKIYKILKNDKIYQQLSNKLDEKLIELFTIKQI